MSSKKIWESIYSKKEQVNIVPYTDVFTFVLSFFKGNAQGKKLLELGCGTGNNIAFAKWALGLKVYGIDQSPTAISNAKEIFSKRGLDYESIEVGDIENLHFEDEYFDIIVDRATLQHNTYDSIKNIVQESYRVLKPCGVFFLTLASQTHYLFNKGKHLGGGDFFNEDQEGIRHFFSHSDILDIFSKFEILSWHKIARLDVISNKMIGSIHQVGLKKPG